MLQYNSLQKHETYLRILIFMSTNFSEFKHDELLKLNLTKDTLKVIH